MLFALTRHVPWLSHCVLMPLIAPQSIPLGFVAFFYSTLFVFFNNWVANMQQKYNKMQFFFKI
jgi:hypothetical protein